MLTVEKLNIIYSKTSNILAEHQTTKIEEDAYDFFHFLNAIKAEFQNVFTDFEDLMNTIAVDLSSKKEKKELVVLREHLNPLLILSKNLHKALNTDPKFKAGLQPDLDQFEIYINDLQEILEDIEKKLSSNSKIDQLLHKIETW